MLLGQAHSFVQQARLAITLAWVAGYTNILTVLTCGVVTSHISGTTSNLGRSIVEGAWSAVWLAFVLLLCFLFGAMLSAICTEVGRRRGWQSIYILPIAIETFLLTMFATGLEVFDGHLEKSVGMAHAMSAIAALAMGLQNATITRISNGVVRTTHMTGVVTDLGLEIVQFFLWTTDLKRNGVSKSPRALLYSMRHHPTPMRLILLISLLGSFTIGAALGTAAFEFFPRWAMVPPVLFLLWIVYQDVSRPIAEIEPSDLTGSGGGLDLPTAMAIFHLRKTIGAEGRVHRMPNLLNWVDRLPQETRVVVLDLGAQSQFRDEAVQEMRAAVLKSKLAGRRLILAGIGHDQLDLLRRHWGEDLHAEDVCLDLDLAIAHGLNILEAMQQSG